MAYPRRSFEEQAVELHDPCGNGFVITPSDQARFDPPTRALFVGGGGNVQVTFIADDGAVVLFTGVLSGTILPIRVIKVWATNTTATNMVGLY